MSLNINYLYKINSLFYKAILYASTVAVIVYVFPKKVQFFYDYENGQPWQSENLYAPFDFAIFEEAIGDCWDLLVLVTNCWVLIGFQAQKMND